MHLEDSVLTNSFIKRQKDINNGCHFTSRTLERSDKKDRPSLTGLFTELTSDPIRVEFTEI